MIFIVISLALLPVSGERLKKKSLISRAIDYVSLYFECKPDKNNALYCSIVVRRSRLTWWSVMPVGALKNLDKVEKSGRLEEVIKEK